MESVVKQTCQWKDCGSAATRHAVVGLSVFGTSDDIHISDTAYTPEHFDLCKKHLELAHLQYVHVKEHPLGECPNETNHG
jgi:hypothetical protein